MRKVRVAVVVSHPIQHFCPQYRSWAGLSNVSIRVLFASRHGLDAYHDPNFASNIKWDALTLDFPHEFLPGASDRSVDGRVDCSDLDDVLLKWQPDVVLVYGYSQPLQRRAAAWAKRQKRRLLMIADSELRSRRKWYKRVIKHAVLRRYFKRIDLFLTVGDANEEYYKHYGVDKSRMVRCFFPIDVETFDAKFEYKEQIRAQLRAMLKVPQHHSIVLTVGKLVPWKRQCDLVQFSNAVQLTRGDVTVVVVGSGPDEARLRAIASRIGPGGVLFAGFVQPRDLVDYYFAADVYCHCAEIEPHSLAISEAIYSGLPVVLSDRCGSYGATDDVQPRINGLVYQCGDQVGLAGALLRLLDEGRLRQEMSKVSAALGRKHQALAHCGGMRRAIEVLGLGG